MVEIALYQRFGTVHVCCLPCQVAAHLFVGISVAVSLVVSLVHHVDAPAVAQLVDVFAVWIVTGSQEIDVGLLHQSYIFLVGGIVNVSTRLGVMVMTVHSAQLHVFAVNLEHFAYYFYFLHA